MEVTFISSTDYECPYCHNQLTDEGNIRVCYSETCQGKKFRVFEIEE